MNILGLDLSLNCSGWFVFNTETMSVIDYGYIPFKDLESNEKMLKIYKTLNLILDTYKIDGAGIEEEFYSSNVDTIKKLSRTHGVALLALSQRGIPFTYYSVMTAKSKTLGGIKTKKEDGTKKNGDEMKQEVANKIFEIFGRKSFIKDFTTDVTDAASIAYTYYVMDGESVKKPKKTKKRKTTKKEK